MRIFGLMVTKNEEKRYLDSAVWNSIFYLDGLFVFDDHSTDNTRKIAGDRGAAVVECPEGVPAFLEHEGAFRQASLESLEQTFHLQDGDWILGLDADEFMVANHVVGVRGCLEASIEVAENIGAWSILLPRFEVWKITSEGDLRIRVDGQWGGMICSRLFKWKSGGQIQQKAMGCGNEPTYINSLPRVNAMDFAMLHFGYVDKFDAQEKYDRYTRLLDHGHDNAHIQSILKEPTLQSWTGFYPEVWRGVYQDN